MPAHPALLRPKSASLQAHARADHPGRDLATFGLDPFLPTGRGRASRRFRVLAVAAAAVGGAALSLMWWISGLGSLRRRGAADRGDIPGWVMIAIMSAAVVVALIPLVGPVIGHAFTNAVNSVTNTGSAGQ